MQEVTQAMAVAEAENPTLSDLLRDFYQKQLARKALEEQLKAAKAEEVVAQVIVLDQMEREDVSSMVVDDHSFSFKSSIKANVLVENRERFIALLKKQGHGELVKPTIAPQTLNSFVKEQIEASGGLLPEWMDGLVNMYFDRSVSIRKK